MRANASRECSQALQDCGEFVDRILQHVDRVKAAPALERPAPLLIRFH